MIQPNVISDLQKYNGSDFPILTVYLGEDSTQAPSPDLLMTQFHSLLHGLTNDQRTDFADDIKKIEKYINSYKPSYRSLVFFCSGDRLWQVANLEFAMTPSITVSDSPKLDTLKRSLKTHSKYLVVLVDREKARIFTVEQGEIHESAEVIGDDIPKNVRSTGRDKLTNQAEINARRSDNFVKKHIKNVAEIIKQKLPLDEINFVVIGGHAEIFRQVANALPSKLQSKVIAGFVIDINAPLNKVLDESKIIASQISYKELE